VGYDELEFREYRLRKIGVRGIFANRSRILRIVTEEDLFEIDISSYEETRRDLDRELSSSVEQTWVIGHILDYFDEIWSEIEEFVNGQAIEEGQEE
jgi:hypothetical protein